MLTRSPVSRTGRRRSRRRGNRWPPDPGHIGTRPRRTQPPVSSLADALPRQCNPGRWGDRRVSASLLPDPVTPERRALEVRGTARVHGGGGQQSEVRSPGRGSRLGLIGASYRLPEAGQAGPARMAGGGTVARMAEGATFSGLRGWRAAVGGAGWSPPPPRAAPEPLEHRPGRRSRRGRDGTSLGSANVWITNMALGRLAIVGPRDGPSKPITALQVGAVDEAR
jgi:hypothetical protein